MTQSPWLALPQTFHVVSLRRALRPQIRVCIVTFAVCVLLLSPEQDWLLAVLAGIMVLSLVTAAVLIKRARIEVSACGIVFYGPGYRVRSTWENLIGCARRPLQMQRVDVLLLARSGLELGRWTRSTQNQDVIPVGWFDKNWRKSEMGQIIEHYAPHAFYRLLR